MKLNIRKTVALLLFLMGFAILIYAFFPIASYMSVSKQNFPDLISPLQEGDKGRKHTDYTKASNWFVGSDEAEFGASEINYYTISIPELGIESATVAIGGEDLSESVIHFPGTSLPGKRGNSVIFGHSILPVFFNPEDYLSIFSTLPTLEEGDEVYVNYDGIKYKYVVDAIFEVSPDDVQILEQNLSESYLTLVTCTPPGDPRKPKRLIVRARLVPIS
jgi:sortase A